MLVDDLQVKHSIRGCVRNLHLGGRPVDITDTDIISGVEHCYAAVEPGVGFTTDSWGIYGQIFSSVLLLFCFLCAWSIKPPC